MKKIVLAIVVGLFVIGCTAKKESEEKVITCELKVEDVFTQEVIQTPNGEDGNVDQESNVEEDFLDDYTKSEMKETYILIDGEVVSYETITITSGWVEGSKMSQDEYVEMMNELMDYTEEGMKRTVDVDGDKVIVTVEITYADVDKEMLQYLPRVEADILRIEDFGYICQ